MKNLTIGLIILFIAGIFLALITDQRTVMTGEITEIDTESIKVMEASIHKGIKTTITSTVRKRNILSNNNGIVTYRKIHSFDRNTYLTLVIE